MFYTFLSQSLIFVQIVFRNQFLLPFYSVCQSSISTPVLPYLIFTHFFLYGFSSVHISSSLSDILSHLINSLEMLNSVKSAFPSRVAFYPGSFSFDFSSYQYDLHQKLKDFFSTSFFNTYHASSDLLEMYDSFYAELYALQDDISYSESLLLTLQV